LTDRTDFVQSLTTGKEKDISSLGFCLDVEKKLSGVRIDDGVYAKHGRMRAESDVGATSGCNGARQAAARALGRPLLEL
jgi:hypothetical protein